MLWQRIASAVAGIPILLYLVWQGGYFFLTLILAIGLVGTFEYGNLVRKSGGRSMDRILGLGAVLLPAVALFQEAWLNPALYLLLVLSFSYYLWVYPIISITDLALNTLGLLYVAWSFAHFILLRELFNGYWLVIYLLVVIWSTDTGAYFTGMRFGKHKWVPSISPNKTWEGFLGGLVFSLAGAWLVVTFSPLRTSSFLIFAAPFISTLGQLGDLFESSLKRQAKVKDSGSLIPGHGGVLDRFDSLLWAAPLTYYLMIFWGWR